MYPMWTEALLATVAKHDKQMDFELKRKQSEVISAGIEAISSGY